MVLTTRGAYPNQGLTLYQVADIMVQHGAVIAFDSGGGGDVTEVINGILTNVPENPGGAERYLPQFVLIYADQEVPSMKGLARENLGNIPVIREKASRYGKEIRRERAGWETEFVSIVPTEKLGTADRDGETWFLLPDGTFVNYQLFAGGALRDYFRILSMPTEPGPDPIETVKDMPVHLEFGGGDSDYELTIVDIVVPSKKDQG